MSGGLKNIRCLVGAPEADKVEAIFEEYGAHAVTISSAGGGHEIFDRHDQAFRLWPHVAVTGLFGDSIVFNELALALYQHGVEAHSFDLADVEQSGWVERWQRELKPVDFGGGLWVCPDNLDPPPTATAIVHLQPGMAFGTGSHPTTAMCLRWLAQQDFSRRCRVLDFGCGSGILAIAAAKLGAFEVMATDIDPDALAVCRANIMNNSCGNISVSALPAPDAQPFDQIVANVLLEPLVREYDVLLACTRPGSAIALSGILVDQVDELLAVYEPAFTLATSDREGEWAVVSGSRV